MLGDAVRRRMVADVPLGAFLSGGIDSSLIVALMQDARSAPVRTYSVGFDEAAFDEAPFAKAVARAAERAVVSGDMPPATCNGGPAEIAKAARRIKDEVGADMTKVDVRGHEDTAADMVRAVVETGLAAYPHVGYFGGPRSDGLHGSPEDHENMMKWTRTLYEAGASMIDLASVTAEIYADVCNSIPIPVIGGQTGPEADGHIHVAWGLVGYRADAIERTDPPSASSVMYNIAQKAFGDIHAGTWRGGMHNPI